MAVLLQSSVFTAKLCNTEFLKSWLCFSSVKLQKWAKTLYSQVKTKTDHIKTTCSIEGQDKNGRYDEKQMEMGKIFSIDIFGILY